MRGVKLCTTQLYTRNMWEDASKKCFYLQLCFALSDMFYYTCGCGYSYYLENNILKGGIGNLRIHWWSDQQIIWQSKLKVNCLCELVIDCNYFV